MLWSKDADRELPPASCTKIMTALLTLEHVDDLDAYATVPDIPLPQTVGVDLRPGDRITVREALTALLVKSANDAALTLASYVGGNEKKFTRLMNERARQLGLTHTHFKNCRGTPEDGHYSSARDLATLGRVAMKDATFRELVRTRTAVIRYPPDAAVPVENHNRLLDYPWGDGIKTGATSKSGKVLVGLRQARAGRPHRRDHARADARPGGRGRARALHVGNGRVPAALGPLSLRLGLTLTARTRLSPRSAP